MITKEIIDSVCKPSPWDKGDKVLYDLCSKYPEHHKDDEIIAKVWLIGRSYAAAIERRKQKDKAGDAFYVSRVAPFIRNSGIDEWLQPVKKYSLISRENFGEIVGIHKKVMDLFRDISGLDKRSLASKYLHFHFRDLFFIYDSRACAGISKFPKNIIKVSRAFEFQADNEYRKFSEKCLALRSHIFTVHDVVLTTRQIDRLLLYATEHL